MKRFLTVAVAMLALTGMGQVAMRKLEDLTNTNLVCVTDYGPQIASLTAVVEGFSNHASLSNLTWTASGHSGTPARLAGFFEGGMAGYAGFGLGMYLDGDDNIAVSNGVISGAALGATAIQPADTNGWETGSHASFLTSEQDLAALRAYHYGSPDIVESPSEWFTFDGAGTITAFDWAAGRENVVIPWAIGGVPVTAIGGYAFDISGVVSLITPQTVTSIGDSAFASCTSLTSISLPQVQTVGYDAFSGCTSLTSVSLPQAQTIGEVAFYYCTSLTAVRMGRNAPAEAAYVFEGIDPPPTVHVTDPQATGWGDTWNGAPVVRPNLYGSNLTAQAFTLGGDTITEWPSGGGGGETSIIAPLYESGTNVTVTSTQSVYSVAVTGAGPVGIDWSGLALDGTGRAEITLRINVTDWAGTNVTFSPALTFDATPEILVTGVWEFAASTIDGVTTRVSQTWPEAASCWMPAHYAAGSGQGWVAATNSAIDFQMPMGCGLVIYRVRARGASFTPVTANIGYSSMESSTGAMVQTAYHQYLFDKGAKWFVLAIPFADYTPPDNNASQGAVMRIAKHGEGQTATTLFTVYFRTSNANERAAYEAGWRP